MSTHASKLITPYEFKRMARDSLKCIFMQKRRSLGTGPEQPSNPAVRSCARCSVALDHGSYLYAIAARLLLRVPEQGCRECHHLSFAKEKGNLYELI